MENGPFIVDLLSIVMCMSYQRVQETVWIFLAHPPKTPPIYAPNDVDIPY
jgi:hypothetical protein